MAKINSTYNAGYRFDHDFDLGRAQEAQKQRKKQRTAEEMEKDSVNRQTMMLPVGVVCDHCGKRIGKSTKVYANLKKLGKERKYLGTLAIWSLTFRCVFCSGKIVMETDPENRDYKVVSGGTRVLGDWKELRDEALVQEQSRAELLNDENTRQAALLEESQRQATKAEELTKFLAERSKMNLEDRIASALSRVQQEKGATAFSSESSDRFGGKRGRLGPGEDDAQEDDDEDGFVFDEAEWLEAQKACGGIITGVVHPPPAMEGHGEGERRENEEGVEEVNPFEIAIPPSEDLATGGHAPDVQPSAPPSKTGLQSTSLPSPLPPPTTTPVQEDEKAKSQLHQADAPTTTTTTSAVSGTKKPKRSALSRLLE